MPLWLKLMGAFCLVVVLRGALAQYHGLRSLLAGSVCGLAALAALALLEPLTGVMLPLNAVTAFTAGVLGLPGVIFLVALPILL